MQQDSWWVEDFSQEGEERLSTPKMRTPTQRNTNLWNPCACSAMFIHVYALVMNESICSCPLSLLSCLFQHQPHHWSCGGADAEPHRRDDGGAEGVRSPDTRQYVWEVGKVNILNKKGLGEQITLLRTSESPRFSLVIIRGGGKNRQNINACRRRCGWFAIDLQLSKIDFRNLRD